MAVIFIYVLLFEIIYPEFSINLNSTSVIILGRLRKAMITTRSGILRDSEVQRFRHMGIFDVYE
jgi:hypothetical protein